MADTGSRPSPAPQSKRSKKKQKEKRGKVFTEAAFAAGLASWGYFVVPSNLIFGELLFVVAAAFGCAAIIEYFESRTWKLVMSLLLLAVTAVAAIWGYSQWITTKKADITHNLLIALATPPSGEASKSFITVKNTSGETLSHYKITCTINSLTDATGSRMKNVRTSTTTESSEALTPGGDTQTQGCIRTIGGHSLLPVVDPVACADITVSVDYSLRTWPEISDQRKLRFMWGKFGEQSWVGQPVVREGSDCQ